MLGDIFCKDIFTKCQINLISSFEKKGRLSFLGLFIISNEIRKEWDDGTEAGA